MKRITKHTLLFLALPSLVVALMSFTNREMASSRLEMETVMSPGMEVMLQWDAEAKELLFTGSGLSQGFYTVTVRNLSEEIIWQGSVTDIYAIVYPINLSDSAEDTFIVEVDNGKHATTSMVMSPTKK